MSSDYLEKSKQYKGYHYTVLKPAQLEYLHDTTTKMLSIIIDILEKNNICYMICGGTLLGAYTTGKFIPWDDDVDICVLEDDYSRMQECISKDIPDWMILQNDHSEPNYYHGWIKIRDRNSIVYPIEEKYTYNGVWIDIYKLKKINKGKIEHAIYKEHWDYLIRRKRVGSISFRQLIKRVLKAHLISCLWKSSWRSICSKNNDVQYVIWSASKIQLEEKWVFPRRRFIFEGLNIQGFNLADQYLEQHYGKSFIELPPEDKRRVGIYDIQFK